MKFYSDNPETEITDWINSDNTSGEARTQTHNRGYAQHVPTTAAAFRNPDVSHLIQRVRIPHHHATQYSAGVQTQPEHAQHPSLTDTARSETNQQVHQEQAEDPTASPPASTLVSAAFWIGFAIRKSILEGHSRHNFVADVAIHNAAVMLVWNGILQKPTMVSCRLNLILDHSAKGDFFLATSLEPKDVNDPNFALPENGYCELCPIGDANSCYLNLVEAR